MTIATIPEKMLGKVSGGVHFEIGKPLPIIPAPGLPKPPIRIKPPHPRLPDVPSPDFIPGPSVPIAP